MKTAKAIGQKGNQWAANNVDLLGQLFDPLDLEAVMSCRPGQWASVAEQLTRLHQLKLGKILFGQAFEQVAEECIAEEIDQQCKAFFVRAEEAPAITRKMLDGLVDAILAQLRLQPRVNSLPQTRKV